MLVVFRRNERLERQDREGPHRRIPSRMPAAANDPERAKTGGQDAQSDPDRLAPARRARRSHLRRIGRRRRDGGWRRRSRRLERLDDRGGERVAAARDGRDVVIAVRAIAERLPDGRDRLGQVVLVHDRTLPDGLEELFLREDASPILDEHEKRVEGAGCQRHSLAAPLQDPARGVQPEGPELVGDRLARDHAISAFFQRSLCVPSRREASTSNLIVRILSLHPVL